MVDISEVKLAINKNTVMIIGFYPNYSQGIIDPIDKPSKLVVQYNDRILLHVDACLGSYLIPFMKNVGYDVPIYDFSLPGVTCLSDDTHKFGNGSKVYLFFFIVMRVTENINISIILIGWEYIWNFLYTRRLFWSINQCNMRCDETWERRLYRLYKKKIMKLTTNLIKKIRKIDELKILGSQLLSVIAFTKQDNN